MRVTPAGLALVWLGNVIPEDDSLWVISWDLSPFISPLFIFFVRLCVVRLVRTIMCIRWSVGLPG